MKKLRTWERWGLVIMLLLAWGLRWIALLDVPPGWRDDDLIELYSFSQEILRSGPQLYFAGASGHEPLYHTLRALWLAIAGLNQASARWLSASFGLLSVLLTWAMARRLFNRKIGLLSGALVSVSFWSLLYSRLAIRHIAALPWMLLAIYWGWRILQDKTPPRKGVLGLALGTAGALMTYYAGRLIPPLLIVALPFVGLKEGLLWQPSPLRKQRLQRYLWGLGLGILIAAPMFWAAMQIPGGDARVSEVAVPITALKNGDLKPLIETTLTTLSMFHAKGDPEFLYNISERPVFGILGALIFYIGVLSQLIHIQKANARLLLLWLGTGLAPAFISHPPSSYGHTILALPAVYILLALPSDALKRRWSKAALPLALLTLGLVTARDIPDYFIRWPQDSMVRFLYRADYRALTAYLDSHPEIKNATIGSFLPGPWDQVAVATDIKNSSNTLGWVDPQRALLAGEDPRPFYFQDELPLNPIFEDALGEVLTAPQGMQGFSITLPQPAAESKVTPTTFANALQLQAVEPLQEIEEIVPGATLTLKVWWWVKGPLPLPPQELIANPPPPGVYNGPRLKAFAHLLSEKNDFIGGDDGLWVDPYSLQVGDQFIQIHHFQIPNDAPPGPYTLSLGLYDPESGQRWQQAGGQDSFTLQLEP